MGDVKRKYGERQQAHLQIPRSAMAAHESAGELGAAPAKAREHMKAIYVSVSNHYEGFSPATIRTLAEFLGESVVLPETCAPKPEKPGQLTLL